MNDPTTEDLLKLTTGPASKRTDGVSMWIYMEVMRTDGVSMWSYMEVMLPEQANMDQLQASAGYLLDEHVSWRVSL